ncbi:MAG TPA: type IV secretory system conjugative DNA transfer family protein [Thiomonas arsenitoxydans]|uniref:type IV secretory system conjugative DNA transfer family protein n=1 Tax=Thiomonas TaxID=32012 RepID=UPI00257CDF86|nr:MULTISPECIES: type IV secretory system conjugative DNA transfer family protein [Thiomonas]HML81985.1 type IV secretory system conjugative DNA transfer family protein [Thiomonas arsenitoxydans]
MNFLSRIFTAARNFILIFGAAYLAAKLLQIFNHPAASSLTAIGGFILALYFAWDALTYRGGVKSSVADVKTDAANLKKLARGFDPECYINLKKGIFLGLDGNRKPVYYPRHVIDKNHIEILGESGVGKSSLAGVLLSQLAAAGETVVVFDPKPDRMLPGTLARMGEKFSFPVTLIDLRPQAGPQLNPFLGCRPDQVEELLQVALELGKTGDAGVDFYRGGDREATSWIAQSAPQDADIQALIAAASQDDRVTEKENLWRELRQLGRVRALHTQKGFDLAGALSKPGVVYVMGSTTRLEIVAAQKLILQRVLQILEDRADQERPVCLFLDELKYLLSPAALRAAGTIRDRNAHLIFAHQSLGDLDDCPGLNPKAVRGAIWGNSGLKFVYKSLDANTARELEAISGQASSEVTSVTRSTQGESVSRRAEKQAHMPAHVFTHLPKPEAGEASVGVVIGRGPATFLSTRWLKSGPTPAPVTVPEQGTEPQAPQPSPDAPIATLDDDQEQPAEHQAEAEAVENKPAQTPEPTRTTANDLSDLLRSHSRPR